MPNGIEIMKDSIERFGKVQRYMLIAQRENATETYNELKNEYLELKALLNVSGVNLTDIDKIKE